MTRSGIVSVGSINIDLVAYAKRRPMVGETFSGEKFHIGMGGKGANQAIQAALSGAKSAMVARVGNDVFASFALKAFDHAGVNREFVIEDEIGTGIGHVIVEGNGDYSTVIIPRANGNLCPVDLDRAASVFDDTGIILLQLEVPLATVEYAARLAHQKGLLVILNAAPAAVLPQELLKNIDVLVVNEIEAEKISGMKISSAESLDEALSKLHNFCGNVVITLGGQGLVALTKQNKKLSISGHQVTVVNTIGAGDAFIGELAARISDGKSIDEALCFANAAGAIAVMQATSQSSTSNRELIEKLTNQSIIQIR